MLHASQILPPKQIHCTISCTTSTRRNANKLNYDHTFNLHDSAITTLKQSRSQEANYQHKDVAVL